MIATGRLKSRSYDTKEGEKRTVIELDVDEIGPSLRYASAKVTKAERGGSGGGFGGQGGWPAGRRPVGHRWLRAGPPGRRWSGRRGVASRPPPAARAQPQGGQQGGWGQAPSYDEPPF